MQLCTKDTLDTLGWAAEDEAVRPPYPKEGPEGPFKVSSVRNCTRHQFLCSSAIIAVATLKQHCIYNTKDIKSYSFFVSIVFVGGVFS